MHAAQPTPDNLIPGSALVEQLQRSRARICRDIANGEFPKPLKLGSSSRWLPSKIAAHIEALSTKRFPDGSI